MSDNRYRVGQFKRGQPVTAHNLNRLKEAARAIPLRRNPFGRTSLGASGQSYTPYSRSTSSGTALIYIEITDSTNFSTYTGTIFDNPIDRNVVKTGVTVRALKHDAGIIPNSSAGKGEYGYYESENDVYIITSYSVAHG